MRVASQTLRFMPIISAVVGLTLTAPLCDPRRASSVSAISSGAASLPSLPFCSRRALAACWGRGMLYQEEVFQRLRKARLVDTRRRWILGAGAPLGGYLRPPTALAMTSRETMRAEIAWMLMRSLARPDRGMVSVGLNAELLVTDT